MNIFDYLNDALDKGFDNIKNSLENTLDELKELFDNKNNDNLTKENTNFNQGNIYQFSKLDNIIKANQYHSSFWENAYDKIYSEFMEYAEKTFPEKGSLYMVEVYRKEDTCCVYEYKGKDSYGMDLLEIHEVAISKLPEGTLQNTMIRKVNGKFVIDETANKFIGDKVVEWANERIDKLENKAKENRVENDIYLVEEKYRNSLYLANNSTKEKFYEKQISEDVLKSIGRGTILRYTNGAYVIDENLTNLNLNGELNFYDKEKNEAINSDRNQISLIEKTEEERNVTSQTRDKMYLMQGKILSNYANETLDKGSMYYIYNVDDYKENAYLLTLCGGNNELKREKIRGVITINENELPVEAGVDSVLRVKDGKITLDREATNFVAKEMQAKIDEMLIKQEKELNSKRIEGHFYQVAEVNAHRVVLMDLNSPANDTGTMFIGFQEFKFSKELLRKCVEGDIVRYVNGEYVPCEK